jgi:hypothetical protein
MEGSEAHTSYRRLHWSELSFGRLREPPPRLPLQSLSVYLQLVLPWPAGRDRQEPEITGMASGVQQVHAGVINIRVTPLRGRHQVAEGQHTERVLSHL